MKQNMILAGLALFGLVFLLLVPPPNNANNDSFSPPVQLTLKSPDGRLQLAVFTDQGKLYYTLAHDGKQVIGRSRLGLRFRDQKGFDENLTMRELARNSHDARWEQVWGERQFVRDRHEALVIEVKRADSGQHMRLQFRLFDEGLGFRYEVPKQARFASALITDEITQFALQGDADAWWIPSREWNRYEYIYHETRADAVSLVHTPFTIRQQDGVHLAIHEAALVDYSAMSLKKLRDGLFKADLSPRSEGGLVLTENGFTTPWRTILVGDDAADLANADLMLNLNEPNKLGDVSWFTPGKYVGIWWGMHIRDRTWGRDGVHGATTEETRRFIEFAAEYGFDGILVEGWNLGWDGNWYENGDVFSFTEAYPDFDIEALADYARQKGVRLIGHHETSGNISNYENQLEDAFDLYERLGYRAVKTGYVADGGDIKRIDDKGITRYEYHDGQAMVNHHHHVIKRAAEHRLAINPHEPVKGTGLWRTYPNWVSREGARGQEYNAWGIPPNPPSHTTILPFTRMLSGPMDFTPGIFDLRPSERPPVRADMPRHDKRSRIETTLAKQLALYVTIYSPIQMAADLPENYLARPDAFKFIRQVPTDWQDSRTLRGEIGDYIVVARRDRNSPDWYLGAITDENPRQLKVPLDFLGDCDCRAEIYADGPAADYDTNPYDFVTRTQAVTGTDILTLNLGAGGGAAIRFTPRNQ